MRKASALILSQAPAQAQAQAQAGQEDVAEEEVEDEALCSRQTTGFRP